MAFSPDGQTLAAGTVAAISACGTLPPANGPATLTQGAPVYSVAFSPDGQTLAADDCSGDVVLRRQSLSNLIYGFFSRLICGEVRENMTMAQWMANAPGQPYKKTCPAYP